VTFDVPDRLCDMLGDDEFVRALQRCAQAFPSYRDRLPRIPFAYTRTRLMLTPQYEVVVMQWAGGSVSPIHDHGLSRCWVLMLEGTLDVENFVRDNDPSETHVELHPAGRLSLKAGDVDCRKGPAELHRVRNPFDECAYSLQLYAEPLSQYALIDTHTNTQRSVTATCDLELPL
jgi:predicted metal-dependent enzyme (double-stranded beta helix superfamily)